MTGLWARNFATIPEPFEKRAPALAMECATTTGPYFNRWLALDNIGWSQNKHLMRFTQRILYYSLNVTILEQNPTKLCRTAENSGCRLWSTWLGFKISKFWLFMLQQSKVRLSCSSCNLLKEIIWLQPRLPKCTRVDTEKRGTYLPATWKDDHVLVWA